MSGFKYLTAKILKIVGFTTALLMVVTVFVFMPSATSKANADPLNAPTTVSLTRTYNSDGTVTLEATMDKALELSSSSADLYIIGGTTSVDSKTTGSVVDFTVNRPTTGTQQYKVKVNSITSNSVSVKTSTSTWTVTATASSNSFKADDATMPTLNWTTNQALSSQSYYGIYFADVTTGAILSKSKTVGSSGSQAITKFYTGGPHEYATYIAKYDSTVTTVTGLTEIQDATSSVFISRTAWTVGLIVNSNSFYTSDANPILSYTLNQSASGTNSNYAIYIFDQTTGTRLNTPAPNVIGLTGTQIISRFYTGGAHTYVAYVAAYLAGAVPTTITGLSDIQATSNTLQVSRANWQTNLSINTATFSTSDPNPIITYTINQPTKPSGSTAYYAVYIFDQTTGILIANPTPSSSLTGTASVRFYTGAAHTYVAYVASYQTGGPNPTTISGLTDIQVTSNTVNTDRSPWTMSLGIDHTVFSTSDPNPVISFTANQPTSGTNGSYAVYVFDQTTGALVYNPISSSTTGVTSIRFYTGGTNTYIGYIAAYKYGGPNPTTISGLTDIQVTSNTVSTTRQNWTMSLGIDHTVFSTSDPNPVISFTTNQPTSGTNHSYAVYVFDQTTGVLVYNPISSSTTGVTSIRFYTGGTNTYIGYIAAYSTTTPNPTTIAGLTDIQVTSNTVSTTRQNWTMSLSTSYLYNSSTSAKIQISFTANQTTSGTNHSYVVYIFDQTTGVLVYNPISSGTTGVTSYNIPIGASDSFIGYIAAYSTTTPNPTTIAGLTDIQATSNLSVPDLTDGPIYANETSGGGNPSESNCQACAGDPINTSNGEFYKTDTDLSLVGPIQFALKRSYSSQKITRNGDFGYGWTSNYAQKIVDSDSLSTTTSLPTAKQLTITQENGSVVVFNQSSNDNYVAANRVFASLSYSSSSNNFILTRANGYTFIFDGSTGSIKMIKDRNSNSLTMSYDLNGHLIQIISSSGQNLLLTWSGSLITNVTDSAGRSVTYSYTAGNLTTITLPNGGTEHYSYNSARLITTITKLNSGIVTNVYDGTNRVIKQTDAKSNVTNFAYTTSASGTVTTITNPDTSITRDEYNNDYQLVKETLAYGAPSAQAKSYVYNSNSQVSLITNPDNSTSSYLYDSNGNILSHTDELGRTTTATYNSFNEPLIITDPSGRVTTYSYDANGNPLSVTNAKNETTQFSSNSAGQQTQVISPLGAHINYTYDSTGVVNSITNSLNQTTSFMENNIGLPLSVTDPAGNVANKTFDNNGNILTSTDPAGNVTTFTYNTSDNLLSVSDPLGDVTNTFYDLNGNVTGQLDATYHATNYTYDNMDKVLTSKDRKNNITTYTYDLLGNIATSKDALNNVTTYTYNWRGQVLQKTLPSGKIYTSTYDSAGQLLTTKDPSNNVTTYTYNLSGEALTVTDPMSRVTSFTYDALGRVVNILRPDNSTESVTYDADGRKTSYTDALGNIATYSYNSVSQLIGTAEYGVSNSYDYNNVGEITKKTNLADNSYSIYAYNNRGLTTNIAYSDGTPTVSYDYNALGTRSSMNDSNGVTTYGYDSVGRVSSVSNTNDGTIGYSYDANSNLTGLDYSNGNHVSYTYNNDNQMSTVNEAHTGQINYSYNSDGLLSGTVYPNGITTNNTFDANDRLTTMESKDTTNTSVLKFDYTYDSSGLITLQTNTEPTDITSKGYTYDSLSRVNTVSTNSTTDGNYSFDAINNIVGNPSGDSFSYNNQNQLTSKSNTTAGTNFAYSYDARGNRTSENNIVDSNVNSFGYNVADQLTSATVNSSSYSPTNISYSYNGNGLRYQKDKTVSGVTTTDKYIWDSSNSTPLLLEDSNSVYIYGNDATPIAQVNKNNNNVTYLHSDKLGSIRATSNAAGNITGRANYDEYGTKLTGSLNTLFGFAGEYQDLDTGLYYLRARWYDPKTAQFLSVDPKLNTTHSAYGYVLGNPLSYKDPLGLDILADSFNDSMTKISYSGLGLLDGFTGGTSTSLNPALAGDNNCITNSEQFHEGKAAGIVIGMIADAIFPEARLLKVIKYASDINNLFGVVNRSGILEAGTDPKKWAKAGKNILEDKDTFSIITGDITDDIYVAQTIYAATKVQYERSTAPPSGILAQNLSVGSGADIQTSEAISPTLVEPCYQQPPEVTIQSFSTFNK